MTTNGKTQIEQRKAATGLARRPESIPETASTVLAAQAKAEIEARYALALRNPRDPERAREQLLNECENSVFAGLAKYSKRIGGEIIEGPSIRLVEAAFRALRNIFVAVTTIYDDPEKRICRVTVTDVETNATHSKEVTIEKTVERRNLRKGQQAISERTNSNGQTVYTVEATDDDLRAKEGALISMAIRSQGERLIGPLLDEALERCEQTLRRAAKKDPGLEQRKVITAFAASGVQAADLAKYLGHPADKLTDDEVVLLRAVYSAMRDGEVKWSEILAEATGEADQGAATLAVEEAKAKLVGAQASA